MEPDKHYVMRQIDNLIYFVSSSIVEDFDEWSSTPGRRSGMMYVADVVIDAETKTVVKSRYF